MKKPSLKVGIANRGVIHHNTESDYSLERFFDQVAATGMFNYVDKTPAPEEVDNYLLLAEKYALPIRCGGWYYTLGRDGQLLLDHLNTGTRLGTKRHNVQILYHRDDGHPVTNQEVVSIYLKAAEHGEDVECLPCFEIHIDMWSEDFNRIFEVAQLVARHGVTFRMTMDHSHIIFKINNEYEMERFDLRRQLTEKTLILDPFEAGNLAQRLIEENFVWLMHARAAVPNNLKNIWATHPDGRVGRGVQYPFIEPKPGTYHSPWDEATLTPWKEVIRLLLRYHYTNDRSPLEHISTEFIPSTDYGEGSTYSLLEKSVACASWIRKEIAERLGGYHWVYAPSVDVPHPDPVTNATSGGARQQFGNMLLSRTPIVATRSHPLPRHETEDIPRVALEGVIDTPACGLLRIYSVHLAYKVQSERAAQVQALVDLYRTAWGSQSHITPLPAGPAVDVPPTPRNALILGDFNMQRSEPAYQVILNDSGLPLVDIWVSAGHSPDTGVTMPANPDTETWTDSYLDYGFLSANLRERIISAEIDDDADGSDHQPVWFDIDL